MSPAITVTSSAKSRPPPTNNSLIQYRFIDPDQLDFVAKQVRQDLQLAQFTSRLVADDPNDDESKQEQFVRCYATPRRTAVQQIKPGKNITKLLDFEAESNVVLNKLRNLLLEKPDVKARPKQNVEPLNRQRAKTAPARKVTAAVDNQIKDEWLGPATYFNQNYIKPATRATTVTKTSSPRSVSSQQAVSSICSVQPSPRKSEATKLYESVKATLKRIEDDEKSIQNRLADISFSSSSHSSARSPSARNEKLELPVENKIFLREPRLTKDELCQTENLEASQEAESEPDLPSAAESVLEDLEREGFLDKLLQYELDMLL